MKKRENDVEISASVRAKELRFECKPEVEVTTFGEPAVSEDSITERENLPEELEPGKTYRDFAVRWRLGARLEEPPTGEE
jgi:hypothetical protein